jgi:hypothetical protein
MERTPRRRSRALISLLVLGLAGTTAATAAAVDVHGSLRVPSDFGARAPESDEDRRRDHYWDEWNGFLDPRPRGFDAGRELAVVLTGEGALAEEQPGFRIANGGLWPTTLVERADATLRIQNSDPVSHQLFAEGHPEFGATPTSPGLTRQLVAGGPGHWPIRDQLYEHVQGHLHVLPDLVARARVESDGNFHFHNVPAGTYTLKVFRGERELRSQEGVTVAEGRELTLEPIQLGAGTP